MLLALAPVRKRRTDAVAIDADTRLLTATGGAHPGNRNDCTVYHDSGFERELAGRPVMADGGYQGNPEVIMPYRKPRDGSDLPDWKEDLNAGHRKIRTRVEHALAQMSTPTWKATVPSLSGSEPNATSRSPTCSPHSAEPV